ncbi:MAG: hypothetical protein PUD24_03050 [Oscillospiraceae bacterium]|nr:hypothetical protein [Oscillospiraceae bacterium]
MKCPYNRKSEKHVQKWGQKPNDEGVVTSRVITDERSFELAECEKENCGAYCNGRCCYASVNLENR